MLLNPRRYGEGAKDLFITLNCVQENIIRGGQRDRSRRRPDGSRMPKSRAIKGIDGPLGNGRGASKRRSTITNSSNGGKRIKPSPEPWSQNRYAIFSVSA